MIPHNKIKVVDKILQTSFNISIITKIEFLGWDKHTDVGFRKALHFIDFANVIPVTEEIANVAISLRRQYKVKLADAVIAATAIYFSFTLVTRNERDFKKITKLKIYNPFKDV